MAQVIMRITAATTQPTPTAIPAAPPAAAAMKTKPSPAKVTVTTSKPSQGRRSAPASPATAPARDQPAGEGEGRRRHGAPVRWTVRDMAAKWLSPTAASITTEALRIAGITLLGILAVLFGAVLAQHAMPDEPHTPRPGITLQPPAQTPADRAPAEQVPADPPAAKPKPKPKPQPSPKPAPSSVLLRPGDTLWSLARRHHTTVAALQDANGLGSSTTIYAGKRLYLAPPRPAGPPTAPTAPSGPVRIEAAPGESASSANGAVRAVSFARAQLGKPYIWGGTGPRGYDCSGLVQAAWKAAGVKLSRTTYTQIHDGHRTTRSNLAPGDLVITNHGHHVLLYVGGGKVIEAPKPGTVIRTAPLPPHHQVVAYRHITG